MNGIVMCMNKLVLYQNARRFREKIKQRKTPEYWWGRAKEQIEGTLDYQNGGQKELEFARRQNIVLLAKSESSCEPLSADRKIMIGYSRTKRFPMNFILKHIIGIGYPITLSIWVIGFGIAEKFKDEITGAIILFTSLAQIFVPLIIQSIVYERAAVKEFENWLKNKEKYKKEEK